MIAVYRRNRMKETNKASDAPPNKQESLKLTDQFVALLILVFAGAGLLDVSAFNDVCDVVRLILQ